MPTISELLSDGLAHYRAGRLPEAANCYTAVLQRERHNPDALHLLGLVAGRMGKNKDAHKLMSDALAADPRRPGILANRARVALLLGRVADGEQDFRAALALKPALLPALLGLGSLLMAAERFTEASEVLLRASEARPDHAGIQADLGTARMATGDIELGMQAWKAARSLDPHAVLITPSAAQQLGRTLANTDPAASIAVLRAGIAHTPRPELLADLAGLLIRTGDVEQAARVCALGLDASPDEHLLWLGLADALAALPEPPDVAKPLLARALEHEGLDHQLLSRAARQVITDDAVIRDALDRDLATPAALQALSAHPLLPPLLEHTIVQHPAWETLLTALRRRLLLSGQQGRLATAIARQCFHNEYVWATTHDEELALEAAPDALRHMYQAEPDPELATLAEQTAVLAMTDDAVSIAVREMYEQSPYPRLVALHRKPPAPLSRVVSTLFPHARFIEPEGGPSVLIAGCGTGQQAITAANRYRDAKVLAVDLSRASLAWAQRTARALGVHNIDFAQADILALGALDRRFDLVEAGGVLHHMDDPMAGWRVLRDLVRPGGLMKIGLYSEAARTAVVAARAVIAEQGFADDPDGIRMARQHFRSLPGDHPAASIVYSPDFYSVSATRDLVFHVCEHRFTLPQLQECLAALNLDFLGFQHPNPVVASWYAERFPDDADQTDLERWALVEGDHPEAFAGMYQFWCRNTD